MFEDIKSLKDSGINQNIALKDNSLPLSYNKTNKLISALYMVTDILDKDEPLRRKLRTLGVDIISDIYLLANPNSIKAGSQSSGVGEGLETRIVEILSFLDISTSINLISEMNSSILKKEFIELRRAIQDYLQSSRGSGPVTLSEFFLENSKGHVQSFDISASKGHSRTRIGVQKGSTLLKALSMVDVSDRKTTISNNNFEALKQKRRDEIKNIIKDNPQGMSIKDINISIKNLPASAGLGVLAEKTLQRELASMVKDNLLKKVGSKRWSRYFIEK